MTMLSDLRPGDAFVSVGVIVSADPVAGAEIQLLGPSAAVQGSLLISPGGVFSGQLAAAAAATPVQPVPALAAVTTGDILVNDRTGETMVARQVQILTDGSYQWASSLQPGAVWYGTAGWTAAGTATI